MPCADIDRGEGAITRPSRAAPGKNHRAPKVGIEELVRRYDKRLDLWTGKPLVGTDVASWLRLFYDMGEPRLAWDDEDKDEE